MKLPWRGGMKQAVFFPIATTYIHIYTCMYVMYVCRYTAAAVWLIVDLFTMLFWFFVSIELFMFDIHIWGISVLGYEDVIFQECFQVYGNLVFALKFWVIWLVDVSNLDSITYNLNKVAQHYIEGVVLYVMVRWLPSGFYLKDVSKANVGLSLESDKQATLVLVDKWWWAAFLIGHFMT